MAPECQACELDYGFAKKADGPAVLVALIALVVAIAYVIIGITFTDPAALCLPSKVAPCSGWTSLVFFLAVTALLSLLLLRPLRGLLIAVHYAHAGEAQSL